MILLRSVLTSITAGLYQNGVYIALFSVALDKRGKVYFRQNVGFF